MPITVDKNGNPYKITGTTDTSSVILAAGSFAQVTTVYWLQPTTLGHLLTLTDGNGREIITMYCDGANVSQMWPLMSKFNGISCTDMDSGTLYIYIR